MGCDATLQYGFAHDCHPIYSSKIVRSSAHYSPPAILRSCNSAGEQRAIHFAAHYVVSLLWSSQAVCCPESSHGCSSARIRSDWLHVWSHWHGQCCHNFLSAVVVFKVRGAALGPPLEWLGASITHITFLLSCRIVVAHSPVVCCLGDVRHSFALRVYMKNVRAIISFSKDTIKQKRGWRNIWLQALTSAVLSAGE